MNQATESKPKLIRVGHVSEAQGLRGEVYCHIQSEDGSWIENAEELCLIKKNSQTKEFFKINKYRLHKKGFVVHLESFNNRNKSEEYRSADLWVSESVLESKNGEALYLKEIQGFSVYANGILVGEIQRFSTNGLQDLLVVVNSEQKEFEIPFVKDFVLEIKFAEKIITMSLPEGLLELNAVSEIPDDAD